MMLSTLSRCYRFRERRLHGNGVEALEERQLGCHCGPAMQVETLRCSQESQVSLMMGKGRDRMREKYCSGCVIITQKLLRSSSSVWTADRFYIHLGTYSRVVETGVACALAARGGRPCAATCSAAWSKAGIFTGAHEILTLWEAGRGFAAPPAFSSFGPTIHPSIPHPQLETPASPAKGSPST